MRPFRFKLAGVLQIWQRREDAAASQLAQKTAAIARARAHEALCRRRRDDALSRWATCHDPGEYAWHENWIIHVTTAIDEARAEVAACQHAETAARECWVKARRDRRALERLRDRSQTRFEIDARRRDNALMDALALARRVREST